MSEQTKFTKKDLNRENFPFCVESKLYAEIDIYQVIRNPENCLIKQWWEQCKNDARKAQKMPLLSFREDRKKRYVALDLIDIETLMRKANIQILECGYIQTSFNTEFGRDTIIILGWEDFIYTFTRESII